MWLQNWYIIVTSIASIIQRSSKLTTAMHELMLQRHLTNSKGDDDDDVGADEWMCVIECDCWCDTGDGDDDNDDYCDDDNNDEDDVDDNNDCSYDDDDW